MNLAHVHLLLNHFPIIGTLIALGLLLIAIAAKSNDLKRASLVVFVGLSLLTIPAYVSGSAAQDVICKWPSNTPRSMACNVPGLSNALIDQHEAAALWGFAWMEITGAVAWLGLWQFRRVSRVPGGTLAAVLILSLMTSVVMARVGNLGGDIRHPEIRDAQDEAPPPAGEKAFGRVVGSFVVENTWVWPTCETLHFVGLSLLFGVAALVDLRMLGMMKSLSFPALHRLLPWGILAFGVNLITGMLFFVGAPGQYTQNATFYWKLALIVLAGANVLYFTIFDEAWAVGPGDDAPFTAKAFAASALVLVLGVLYFGRMLPFIGNAF